MLEWGAAGWLGRWHIICACCWLAGFLWPAFSTIAWHKEVSPFQVLNINTSHKDLLLCMLLCKNGKFVIFCYRVSWLTTTVAYVGLMRHTRALCLSSSMQTAKKSCLAYSVMASQPSHLLKCRHQQLSLLVLTQHVSGICTTTFDSLCQKMTRMFCVQGHLKWNCSHLNLFLVHLMRLIFKDIYRIWNILVESVVVCENELMKMNFILFKLYLILCI